MRIHLENNNGAHQHKTAKIYYKDSKELSHLIVPALHIAVCRVQGACALHARLPGRDRRQRSCINVVRPRNIRISGSDHSLGKTLAFPLAGAFLRDGVIRIVDTHVAGQVPSTRKCTRA